jgi:hypothetical protein
MVAVGYGRGKKTGHVGVDMNIEVVHRGVTATWLSQVFNMSPVTVKRKLKECPSIGATKAGFLYDLSTAATYLVKPVFSVKEYFKTMKPEELPAKLQDKYWSALMRRIKYEERAGALWRTERVLFVLGEVFQTIKFSLQLWADTLDRATGLSAEQRELLRGMVDALQDELYTKLRELEKEGKTPSVLGEGVEPGEEEGEEGEDEGGSEEEDLIG